MHLSKIVVYVGDILQPKQTIGLVGNSGFVRPRPTTWAPRAGSHLHFMVRLYDAAGNLKWNEYGGAIDPIPFLYYEGMKLPIRFDSDIWWMSNTDSVAHLQTCLKIEFPDLTFEPNGYYGKATNTAVMRLQTRHGISPAIGYVGKLTRQFLNDTYAA